MERQESLSQTILSHVIFKICFSGHQSTDEMIGGTDKQ